MLHSSSAILRLCRRGGRIFDRRCAATFKNGDDTPQNDELSKLVEKNRKKILFNSHLDADKVSMSGTKYYRKLGYDKKVEVRRIFREKLEEPLPISLKYLERAAEPEKSKEEVTFKDVSEVFHLPFKVAERAKPRRTLNKDWMKDYEYFDDTKLDENVGKADNGWDSDARLTRRRRRGNRSRLAQEGAKIEEESKSEEVTEESSSNPTPEKVDHEAIFEWQAQYGTPDPFQPISSVPCSGCGALLHCTDTAVPGYLPSEIFSRRTVPQLSTMVCQRCHFLKEFNIALNMSVSPEEYPRMLSTTRGKSGLVVIMVDLLDFPGSLWPGIFNIIGPNKTVIIAGNKIDLLPQDSEGFLKHIEECLIEEIKQLAPSNANIKCVTLISAKTGYGIEDLITAMHFFWRSKGDTYLVGCTNAGKSSLFNALLQSDYCKVQAIDLVKRATVSQWPGTTLNMLKFPIQKPTDWRLFARNKRLIAERHTRKAEEMLRRQQLRLTNSPRYASLVGHIGRTETKPEDYVKPGATNAYTMDSDFENEQPIAMLDENSQTYADSRWCYDTPGVIQPQQLINLLTTEELLLTIPKFVMVPRNFYMHPGQTMFLGGVCRVDFVTAGNAVRFTVFASDTIPVTVCKTEEADELYTTFAGTEVLTVPKGGPARMNEWPGIKKLPHEFEINGVEWMESAADITFASVGWIAITPGNDDTCILQAWSPHARGVSLRSPPLLPYAVNMKGRRVSDTPAYRMGRLSKGLRNETELNED